MNDVRALEHDRPPTPLDRTRILWLSFAIAMPPLLWNLQILVLSAFANYACFPGDEPLASPAPRMFWVHMLEYGADAIAILITLAAGWTAMHYFRLSREQIRAHSDAGSRWNLDRLCFMALAGMLSAGGFLGAVIFETIASIIMSPCAG